MHGSRERPELGRSMRCYYQVVQKVAVWGKTEKRPLNNRHSNRLYCKKIRYPSCEGKISTLAVSDVKSYVCCSIG